MFTMPTRNFTELLEALSKDIELSENEIYQRHENGSTLLHYAPDRDVAEVLLQFVDESRQEEFLWMQSSDGCTTFDSAVVHQRMDVVDFLFNYAAAGGVTWKSVCPATIPLHHATTKDMAKFLLDKIVDGTMKADFLNRVDTQKRTALHRASEKGFEEVVQYLCQELKNLSTVIWADKNGNTPLHVARTANIVDLLCHHVPKERLKDYLCQQNNEAMTALHTAIVSGHEEVVARLCQFGEEDLLMGKDINECTVLHVASSASIVLLLMTSLPVGRRISIALQRNSDGKMASEILKGDVLKSLCRCLLVEVLLIPCTDVNATMLSTVRNMCSSSTENDLLSLYDLMCDNERNQLAGSFFLWLICEGRVDAVDALLGYVQKYYEGSLRRALCLVKNQWKQNAFHLSSLSPEVESLFEKLRPFMETSIEDIKDVLTPDEWGNTPLKYLVGRFCTSLVSEFILRIPWCDRKQHMQRLNRYEVNCLHVANQDLDANDPAALRLVHEMFRTSIAPYLKITQDGLMRYNSADTVSGEIMEGYVLCDKKVRWAIEYALNQYHQTELDVDGSFRGRKVKTGQLVWFLFDFDASEMTASDFEKELRKLDTQSNQGKPKVVIIRFAAEQEVTYLSPPGPDFAVLTMVSQFNGSDILESVSTAQFTRLDQLVDHMKWLDTVEYVNVNSTLGRHFERPNKVAPENAIILQGGNQGKALIICYVKNRDYYKAELKQTERMFALLGLEVKVEWGAPKEDVLLAIRTFSSLPGHGDLAAVAVMTHGNTRGDMCDDSKETFSVTDVLDAMSDLQSYALVFLTFCRGDVPQCQCNRTRESYEYTTLRVDAAIELFKIESRTIRPEELSRKREERDRHFHPRPSHPSVTVPEHRLLVYPTLPDSLLTGSSEEVPHSVNKMATCFEKYLEHVGETHHSSQPSVSPTSAGVARTPAMTEVFTLLTDVAGLVREKSAFTQYMNVSYTVNSKSRPVYLALAPSVGAQV